MLGFTAVDPSGEEIGTVRCVWEDTSRKAAFLGIKTGWLGLGSIHAVPGYAVELGEDRNTVRLPFTRDVVKDAPSYDVDEVMTATIEKEIYDYYSNRGVDTSEMKGTPTGPELSKEQRFQGTEPSSAEIKSAPEKKPEEYNI